MNARPLPLVIGLLLLLPLAGCPCGKPGAGPAAGKPPVAVETVPATAVTLTAGLVVTGNLAAKYQAAVKAEFPGRVAEVYVTEWVPVAAGEPLVRLEGEELDAALAQSRATVEAARAGVLAAEVADSRAVRELARTEELFSSGLATRQQLDEMRSGRDASRAALAAARAQLTATAESHRRTAAHTGKLVIGSPMAGVVAHRAVNVGQMVNDNQPPEGMFLIVDNRLLELVVTVPSYQLALLAEGQEVAFATDAWPGDTFVGRIARLNPQVDPVDRSLKVFVEVVNADDRLKSGMFVTGRIVTGARDGVLAVPREALQTWSLETGRGALFVAEHGVARQRAIVTGAIEGNLVEVVSGLQPGEAVITRGAFNVRDGDRIVVVGAAAAPPPPNTENVKGNHE